MAQGVISSYTASGKKMTDQSVRGIGSAVAGTKLEDGRIIPKPRPKTDRQLLSSGPGVRVVNPSAIPSGKKHQSLGRDGQIGTSRD